MEDVGILFAGIPVSDFKRALAWYTRLFGSAPEIVVKDDEVMWRFSDTAWLYVVEDRRRAGRSIVTLSVPDLDRTVAAIGARGIAGEPIQPVGDAGRKASFDDADGNTVSFVQINQPQ